MSNSINIALLGAGWFGREAHLRNLVSIAGVNVLAVSSRSTSSLEAAREIVGADLPRQRREQSRNRIRISPSKLGYQPFDATRVRIVGG